MGLIFASFCHETLKWRGVRRECAEPLIHSETRFLYANRKSTSLENASQTYQPACKPGSVGYRELAHAIRDGHSSGTTFARCLEQPTRTVGPDMALRCYRQKRTAATPSLFGFAPGVVCHAIPVAGDAVRSYRTFSPLPSPRRRRRRFVLCGTVPGVAPAGRYPAPYVDGARTFLPRSLSAVAGAAVRPTDAIRMAVAGGGVKPCGSTAFGKMKIYQWDIDLETI